MSGGAHDSQPLLEVTDLAVTFGAGESAVAAVDGASFTLAKGETLALVGESGSGKTVTALSILQLLPYPRARHPHGSIRFLGEELIGAKPERLREIRGNRIAMVFQEPMTSLNPLHRVERQIGEVLRLHKHLPENLARDSHPGTAASGRPAGGRAAAWAPSPTSFRAASASG